jgi:hypothetical protein
VLDHVLLDVIAALRNAFDRAMLEREAVEERFQVDVLLGDVTFETSYTLPGEGDPPRVRMDLNLEWPTWSQTAYRLWSLGEPGEDPPELGVELALRVQHLASPPEVRTVLASLPSEGPATSLGTLERAATTIEQVFEGDETAASAIEVVFEGAWTLGDELLEEPAALDEQLLAVGQWVTSALVRLGDLPLAYLPPPNGDA